MTVYLVGAGPGDASLLTLRAAELLRRCDAVIYDRLVSDEVLAMVAPWAKRVDVGKTSGGRGKTQEQINLLLIDHGRRHDCVVRLKSGDPHVFGRGAEEAAALVEVGIAVEVVPGVSSALAAPTAAGIPLTTRGVSSGFTVITAHQDPATDRNLDWDALARLGTTLVVLMGAARARLIAERLLAGGMPACTPVTIVVNASRAGQREERLTLADLGLGPVDSPAVIVIGQVAALDLRNPIFAMEGSTS